MSELDMDQFPRMASYMKAADLDDEACIALAETILQGLATDLKDAARRAARDPSEENLHHLEMIRDMYKSEYFQIISLGVVNGEEAARAIIKKALRGRRSLGLKGGQHEAIRICDQVRW